MNGKIVGSVILVCALLAGGGLYLLEHYHWYEITRSDRGKMTLTRADGSREEIAVRDFNEAEGSSSPLKYRACFQVDAASLPDLSAFTAAPDATPTVAPRPFACFDASAIGEALRDGTATAFLGTENATYGIDRIVAITEAGAGFAWHQINRCGERVFDGDPPPAGCPPPPTED